MDILNSAIYFELCIIISLLLLLYSLFIGDGTQGLRTHKQPSTELHAHGLGLILNIICGSI